jgi:hypothetical protein
LRISTLEKLTWADSVEAAAWVAWTQTTSSRCSWVVVAWEDVVLVVVVAASHIHMPAQIKALPSDLADPCNLSYEIYKQLKM